MDRSAPLDRLRRLLVDRDLDAVVLRTPADLAWATGGARLHVNVADPTGVARLVVTADRALLVTAVNEVDRLRREEVAGDVEWRVLPWAEDLDEAVPHGPRVGVSGGAPGSVDVTAAVEAARRALTGPQAQRYRELGADAAGAVTEACEGIHPADPEHAVAAAAGRALLARGIEPLVLLVAGAGRLPQHRHPLATAAATGDRVMVVVCGRRSGLVASLTRFVAFSPLSTGERDVVERLLLVERAFLDATRVAVPVRDVLAAGCAAYAEQGFDAGEWQRHHQGGPTGYLARDHVATPACDEPVEDGQAFAWNPSGPSAKVEDTVLVTGSGLEVLTVDPQWPTVDVAGRGRPWVLERS